MIEVGIEPEKWMLLGIMYVLEDMAGWQDIALKALPVFGVEDGLCG